MGTNEAIGRADEGLAAVESTGGMFGDLIAGIRRFRTRRRTRRELMELSDRMLRDIGLTRADARFMRWENGRR